MKLFRFMAMLLVAASIALTACDSDDGSTTDVDVTFISAVQTGGTSGTADSTGIILTFDVDPETLTAEDITVTGATKGALTGSDTTRSLAISDITVADGETVTVTITSPVGYAITGSPQTAVVYRLLAVGVPHQGGIIAYIYNDGDPGYVFGETHGLIAAAEDQNGGSGIQWGGRGVIMSGNGYFTGEAIGDGKTNTDTIVNFFNSIHESADPYRSYYDYDWAGLTEGTVNFTDGMNTYDIYYGNDGNVAAKICADYEVTVNGVSYDDWYLPSKDELKKLYDNKNSVGGFSSMCYWSSSEYDVSEAWAVPFAFSGHEPYVKNHPNLHVRAVRDF